MFLSLSNGLLIFSAMTDDTQQRCRLPVSHLCEKHVLHPKDNLLFTQALVSILSLLENKKQISVKSCKTNEENNGILKWFKTVTNV